MSASVAAVTAWLEAHAPATTAADWDRVGLVAGDPAAEVRRVLFAVDPLPAVIAEAVDGGYDLLVCHHPLLLRGVSSIAETTSRGRSLAALVRAGCALLTMHTNADQAVAGVSDALADAIGMAARRTPIEPLAQQPPARIVVHVPVADADAVIAAMAAAGAGRIGYYSECAYWVDGTGQFRPQPGAAPAIGAVGTLEHVPERRVEMVAPTPLIGAVVAALRAAHPYEEPAFSVVPALPLPGPVGIGRVGEVEPCRLGQLAQRLATALPPNHAGVRVAGDLDRPVRTVAVSGGSGDSLLGAVARLGVDAFITSDLRHHPVTDFRAEHDTAVLDIPHASGESLWLRAWADRLAAEAATRGAELTVAVSAINTDPWTAHFAAPRPDGE